MLDKEVAQFLHSKGAVVFDELGTAGNIICGMMPSGPDECVMIEAQGGPVLNYPSPVLHLIIRGTKDPATGLRLAQKIHGLLNELDGLRLSFGGTYVVGCTCGAPAHIGMDENGRHEYTLTPQFVTE